MSNENLENINITAEGGEGESVNYKAKFRINPWFVFLLFLVGGFVYFYFHFFVYYDASNNCRISIKLSMLEWSNLNIKKALGVLKYGSPEDYKLVCKNIKKINPNISCGGWQGGCFHPNSGDKAEIDVSTAHGDFLAWTAGVIVHETCHYVQYKEGRDLDETECYAKGDGLVNKLVVTK